jgi:hypothetical protein
VLRTVGTVVFALSCFGFAAQSQTSSLLQYKEFACRANGAAEISIDCAYATQPSSLMEKAALALDHAKITFNAHDESIMHVGLTFRNVGGAAFTERRTVYIEFDDEGGRNFIRRPLPSVNFQQVGPGEKKTFTESFLVPALLPGRYLVRLWIPSPEPALKFEASQNLLLRNEAVPEAATRLNHIADIVIER